MIPVLNVYYMLSYAFKVLNEQGYKSITTEKFENSADLCAAILVKGVSIQLKRGLLKDYVPTTEELTCPRGKIEITESIQARNITRRQLVCTHDEFTEDFYMNQILKTTMLLLIRSDISTERKKELRKLLLFFGNAKTLDVQTINWRMQFNRNNQSYQMLISVCYLVIKGLLQSKSNGSVRMMDFLDEQRMYHLYEKFILEYYRKEFPQITANASQIPWQLDDGFKECLPIMQSDIMLTYEDRTLIIDAKYYQHSLQKRFDRLTAYSNNLYQIFTYVKNKEESLNGKPHEKVAGMLLYAQTEDEGKFEKNYKMSGNPISIKTLDLSQDFSSIRFQLDSIARKYMKVA